MSCWPSCNFDYATAAYDASTGGQLWVRRYNGPGNEDDIAWSLAASPDGSKVFVTGYSTGTTSSLDYATIAYDGGTGSIVWLRRYNGPANGNDFARALGVSPDGSAIYVTGSSEDLAGNENSDDFATLAYSEARGRRLWTQRFNGPANLRDDADSIAVTGSRVFVTGMSNSYTTGDFVYAALAYDARSGVLSWATWSAGPAHTYSDVTVSPDGAEVFMTGTTTGALTVAYDSTTGSQLWKRIYNGLGDEGDYVTSIATSPDSSAVFVAGDAEYVKGTSDWAGFVLAYSALSMANEKSPLVAR